MDREEHTSTSGQQSEKKVEYIELIYDLIFVYLISRNGDLLHTMQGDFIRPMAFFTFTASTLIILQIWYFSMLLINRYGSGYLREFIGIFINMYLMYFMADGIRDNWGGWYHRYNAAWALILINLAVQYLLCLRRTADLTDGERSHIRSQILVLVGEAALVLLSIPIYDYTGFAFGPWAMIFGFVMPLITRETERKVPVDFPHLSERVMLYVVFTFGEMLLAIAQFFEGGIDLYSIYFSLMAFLIVAGLFSSYGYYYNHLLDQQRTVSATAYMYLHMVMIYALSIITAALEFMRNPWVAAVPKTIFLISAVGIYFLCLLMTQQFSRYAVSSRRKTYLTMGVSLLVYAALTALFYKNAYVGIAFSVAFIYLQLLIMHFGKNKKEGEPKP